MVEIFLPAIRRILDSYEELVPLESIERVEKFAGFSGSKVWRVGTARGDLAVKCWPTGTSADGIAFVHSLQRAALRCGLTYVSEPLSNRDNATFVFTEGCFWDVCIWMMGSPLVRHPPTNAEVDMAVTALASIHKCLNENRATFDLSRHAAPELKRRLLERTPTKCWTMASRIEAWRKYQGQLETRRPGVGPVIDALGEQTGRLAKWLADWLEGEMLNKLPEVVPEICLVDIHSDHILFHEGHLSGLIDFGAAGIDTIARDLGRLLGSMVGNEEALWERGFDAYSRVRNLSCDERQLAKRFDRTGVVLSALGWRDRLSGDRPLPENVSAILDRWRVLLDRMNGLNFQYV